MRRINSHDTRIVVLRTVITQKESEITGQYGYCRDIIMTGSKHPQNATILHRAKVCTAISKSISHDI